LQTRFVVPGAGAVTEFRLLGPVEWQLAGRAVDLGTPKQRTVLAALLVDAGQPVPMATLIDRVWGEAPPVEARNVLYAHMARIRRMVAQAGQHDGHEPPLIHRAAGGYRLDVARDRVDMHRFRRLAERGQTAGTDQERVAALREALALWRGPALVDLAGAWAERTRAGWSQLHLDTVVRWAQAELRVGNALSVIGPLTELVAQHPLGEPAVAVLMRALCTAGRAADALECYAAARRRLGKALGSDPGPELQRLHQAILRGELAPEASTVVTGRPPAQLPLDLRGFAGRGEELARLDRVLAAAAEQPTAVVISAVSGTAGVGKTALAVHWAHRVRDRFPDGQLYANLRGFDPNGAVVSPAEAVRGFLDALGVPAHRVPAGLGAQVGLYRSMLAGRRVLVVLDNARDADQVRPLLPGSPGCLVVVTSRNELAGLVAVEGAVPLPLDLLSAADARQLLARRIGAQRVAAEPAAVDEIIARCARLPLALAIVACRAITRPGFPLAVLAEQLREAQGGLAAFAEGFLDVRDVFRWSYQILSAPAARLFRLLGLHGGPDIAAAAAASLAGVARSAVGPLLAELTRAHLVCEHTPGRYTFHDLLRAYAAELAQAVDADHERAAATRRLLDHYLHTAYAADRVLYPFREPISLAAPDPAVTVTELPTEGQALHWLVAEHQVLLGAVQQASGGFDQYAWQLAWTLTTFLDRRGHWHDQATVHSTGLRAAVRLGDRLGEVHAHRGLALAYAHLGRADAAAGELQRALTLFGELGDPIGQADMRLNLAWLYGRQERTAEALDQARQALALFRAAGHRAGQARALNSAGYLNALLGDCDTAVAYCEQALDLLRQLGDRRSCAAPWDSLGYAHHQRGDLTRAVTCYQRALHLFRDVGDRYHEADTLTHLGDAHLAAGRAAAARDAWQQAADILDTLDRPDAEQVRTRLRELDRVG
jgi:DNA-binding SARP family transcriptional activator/tetratricopeptide (TPR) repeat protein